MAACRQRVVFASAQRGDSACGAEGGGGGFAADLKKRGRGLRRRLCRRVASLRSGGNGPSGRGEWWRLTPQIKKRGRGSPLSGCAGLSPQESVSHDSQVTLLPYSTAITDSQYFARHCVPPKYVRWCDSCSLATPSGGRINFSMFPCGVMWHIDKHP